MKSREEILAPLEASIKDGTRARLELGLVLALTSLIGALSSYQLLRLGMKSMPLRYPLSVLPAYCAFFALVGLWVFVHRRHIRPHQIPDLPADKGSINPFESLELVPDVDEGCLPIIVIGLVLGVFIIAYFAITLAPYFLAELLLEAAFAGSLYQPLKGLPTAGWARLLLRRTFWTFLFTAFVFCLLGGVLSSYAPNAHSIGGVVKHFHDKR